MPTVGSESRLQRSVTALLARVQIPETLSLTPTTPKCQLFFWLLKQFLNSPQQQATLATTAFVYAACELRAWRNHRNHLRSVRCHSDRSELAAGSEERLLTILRQTDPTAFPGGTALRCSAESFT